MEKGAKKIPAVVYDIKKAAFVKTYLARSLVEKVRKNFSKELSEVGSFAEEMRYIAYTGVTYPVVLAKVLDPEDKRIKGYIFSNEEVFSKTLNEEKLFALADSLSYYEKSIDLDTLLA